MLHLVVYGKNSREIADILKLSARTVENHRSNIMKKMGVKNSISLINYVIHKGVPST